MPWVGHGFWIAPLILLVFVVSLGTTTLFVLAAIASAVGICWVLVTRRLRRRQAPRGMLVVTSTTIDARWPKRRGNYLLREFASCRWHKVGPGRWRLQLKHEFALPLTQAMDADVWGASCKLEARLREVERRWRSERAKRDR